MFLDNIELFNVGALESVPGLGEHGLVRVPKSVRDCLNNRGRFIGMTSVGCELQFVSDAPNIDIYLSCTNPHFSEKGEVQIYKGDFLCVTHQITPGIVNNIRFTPPAKFNEVLQKTINSGGFSSNVCRVVFNRGTTFVIHGIDTMGHEIRPPKAEEKPKLNWLAYGSSITNSSLDGYPHFAAKQLKVQVQNKGFSGSCHIEKELVDFMVDECSCDFFTSELGVNMRGAFTPEEFEQRASYLIDRFSETGKPVFIISIFPNSNTSLYIAKPGITSERENAYNIILEDLVAQKQAANLHFISGSTILDDFSGLSGDLIHPTSYGHAVMGANLSKILRKKLDPLFL